MADHRVCEGCGRLFLPSGRVGVDERGVRLHDKFQNFSGGAKTSSIARSDLLAAADKHAAVGSSSGWDLHVMHPSPPQRGAIDHDVLLLNSTVYSPLFFVVLSRLPTPPLFFCASFDHQDTTPVVGVSGTRTARDNQRRAMVERGVAADYDLGWSHALRGQKW
jgi:hypothetical protein